MCFYAVQEYNAVCTFQSLLLGRFSTVPEFFYGSQCFYNYWEFLPADFLADISFSQYGFSLLNGMF